MDAVVVRAAGSGDALLVAALALQAARAEGLEPEPGFLDQYAEAWCAARRAHPAWWAEAGGLHAGLLVTRCLRPLPWPGRRGGGSLTLELLYARAGCPSVQIRTALRAAAREWAAARGLEVIDA